jgi:hypothetical protein
MVYLTGVVDIVDRGKVFNTEWQAYLVGRKWNSMKAEVAVGRDGFAKDLGIRGSSNDGNMVTA